MHFHFHFILVFDYPNKKFMKIFEADPGLSRQLSFLIFKNITFTFSLDWNEKPSLSLFLLIEMKNLHFHFLIDWIDDDLVTRAVRGLEAWHNYGSQQLYFSFYRNLSRKKKASAGQKSHIKLVCRVLTYWDFYAAILKPIWARPSFPSFSSHWIIIIIIIIITISPSVFKNVVFPSHLKPT